MKNLIKPLAFACLSLSFASTGFSADAPAEVKLTKAEQKAAELNHIVLKDGKAWVMKDGEKAELTAPVTLLDGTQVWPDGSYAPTGGEKKALKDGEAINWEGKVQNHSTILKKIEDSKENAANKPKN